MRVLIVLGNKLMDDGGMSDVLADRLSKVIEVEPSFDILILSGGAANPNAGVSEAFVMRDYLLQHGVDESKIVLEDLSLTTKQNAQFCAPIVEKLGVKEITVLSSAGHLRRWYLNPIKLFSHYTKCKVNSIAAQD